MASLRLFTRPPFADRGSWRTLPSHGPATVPLPISASAVPVNTVPTCTVVPMVGGRLFGLTL